MALFHHRIHGLSVESEIELPVSTRVPGTPPDIRILLGTVPGRLENVRAAGVLYEAAPGEFLLELDGVARYWVRDGREIVVQKDVDADDDSVRVFLLGSALGALIHQRKMLPLHASAVVMDGKCIGFAGRSGIGKSTLAAAFCALGYPALGDDVLVVGAENGGPAIVWPEGQHLKLWADSARRLRLPTRSLPRFRGFKKKYLRSPETPKTGIPYPLTHLYVIERSDDARFTLERLQGSAKLESLIANTYRPQFLEGLDRQRDHFRLCAELGSRFAVSRIRRPSRRFELKRLQKLILEDLCR